MSKATPEDVKNLGLNKDMFSSLDEVTEFEDFVQSILDDAVFDVKDEIGDTEYDNPDNMNDVIRAEKYLAAAELWDIRAAIVASQAVPDGPDGKVEEARADKYRKKGQKVMDKVTGDDEPVFSTSVEISEHGE